MQLVEQAILPPGQCAITGSGDGPFIDTLRENDLGMRIYISVFWFEETAAALGWSSSEDVDSLATEIIQLRHQVEQLEQDSETLDQLRGDVRRTLAQGAVVVSREPGGGLVTEFKLRGKKGRKDIPLEV